MGHSYSPPHFLNQMRVPSAVQAARGWDEFCLHVLVFGECSEEAEEQGALFSVFHHALCLISLNPVFIF